MPYEGDLLNKRQVAEDETDVQFEYDRKKMYMDVKATLAKEENAIYRVKKKSKKPKT